MSEFQIHRNIWNNRPKQDSVGFLGRLDRIVWKRCTRCVPNERRTSCPLAGSRSAQAHDTRPQPNYGAILLIPVLLAAYENRYDWAARVPRRLMIYPMALHPEWNQRCHPACEQTRVLRWDFASPLSEEQTARRLLLAAAAYRQS